MTSQPINQIQQIQETNNVAAKDAKFGAMPRKARSGVDILADRGQVTLVQGRNVVL